MVGKIYNWNLKEQLVVFRTDEETNLSKHCLFINKERKLQCMGKTWDDFELDTTKIGAGDILEISETGVVKTVFFAGTSEIDIFVTNHCNSNCVMCPLSENVRRQEKRGQAEWIKNYIKLLPEQIDYVNVTGGGTDYGWEGFF